MTMNNRQLSLFDTNVLKGIAIMLMLWHHLFYIQNGLYNDITICGYNIIQSTGVFAKLCVAIFVFLSGYGLTIKVEKDNGIASVKKYYIRRFSKLYLNYWFVWIIFIPLSEWWGGRTFTDAYGTNLLLYFCLDFMGIIHCFGKYGYNPTWWFYSCIILLYLLYPLLYKITKNNTIYAIIFCVAINYLPKGFGPIHYYIYAFLAGIICVAKPDIRLQNLNKYYWLALLIVLIIERNSIGILIDVALTITIVEIYLLTQTNDKIKKALAFVGKHSMNIFLFHTFIYLFWFKEEIYATRNPIIIFTLLLSVCLIISILLEHIKNLIKFDKLVTHFQ